MLRLVEYTNGVRREVDSRVARSLFARHLAVPSDTPNPGDDGNPATVLYPHPDTADPGFGPIPDELSQPAREGGRLALTEDEPSSEVDPGWQG